MILTRIKRLPVFIANQIAAGEVIERPASVVKELLENAIDAKATQIHVEIGFGGLNLIKVSDNGLGILSDDLLLAIAPHATSKISQLDDLYAIQSMGFRGEALASISSVSRLVICSKSASEEHAMRLDALTQAMTCCARAQGTTIEVHDIFFNAPVRKKFLKSERGEFQAIESLVKRVAMSAPHVAMSLTHNGQLLWQLSPALCHSSMQGRIMKLLGKKFLDGASHLEAQHAGMQLEGWVGDVNYQRSQNDGLWIYLNNRMVKDKLLHHAVKQAYSVVLQPGRHPVCLLYLSVNPAEVDVNVHPTKHEVRFQQARLVHDFIVSQVSRAIDVPEHVMEHESLESPFPRGHLVNAMVETHDVKPQVKHGLDGLSRIEASEALQIIALDQSFALLIVDNEVYLADLTALRAHWFSQSLFAEMMPWGSRPLLVPVQYRDESRDFKAYSNHYSLLHQLGFDVEILESSKLSIRTLPNVIPQLDIPSFLQAVFLLPAPTLTQLISILAANFSQHADIMSFEQQAAFNDEVLMQIKNTQHDAPSTFIKKLSSSWCQELLYG